jgi:hypothetical protein
MTSGRGLMAATKVAQPHDWLGNTGRSIGIVEQKASYGDTLFVPPRARWNDRWTDELGNERPALKDTQNNIGEMLDKAIGEVEGENEALHGVLKGHIDFNAQVAGLRCKIK